MQVGSGSNSIIQVFLLAIAQQTLTMVSSQLVMVQKENKISGLSRTHGVQLGEIKVTSKWFQKEMVTDNVVFKTTLHSQFENDL
jgi:hypothetical protein